MALFKNVPPCIDKKANKAPVPSLTAPVSLNIVPSTLLLAAGDTGHATVMALNYRGEPVALPSDLTITNHAPSKLTITLDGSQLTLLAGAVAGSVAMNVASATKKLKSNTLTTTIAVAPPSPVFTTLDVTSSAYTPTVSTPVTISAQARDQFGAPRAQAGLVVTWSKTGTGGSFASPTSVTDGTGRATVGFTVSDTAATSHVVTGTSGSVAGHTNAVVTQATVVVPPTRVLTSFAVLASSFGPLASATVTITAQARDQFGVALAQAGIVVTWSKTGAGGSFASATSATDSQGIATVGFTVSSAGGTVHVVTATAGAVTGVSASISVAPVARTFASVSVTASSYVPPISTTITITVQAIDQFGVPLAQAGVVFTWSKTGTGGSFAAPTSTTDATGRATVGFTVSGTGNTQHVVTATAGLIAGQTSTITAQPALTGTIADQIFAFMEPVLTTPTAYAAHGLQWYVDRFTSVFETLWGLWGPQWDASNNIAQYDRPAFFYYWWAVTGDAKWLDRGTATLLNWRDTYLIPNGYSLQPHQLNSESLWLHWLITGDTVSRDAILQIASRTGLAYYNSGYMKLSQGENRIQSRILSLLWMAEKVQPGGPWGGFLETAITNVLDCQNASGFFPFDSTCGGQLNYMGGMVMDTLLRLHDQRPGPYTARIETAALNFATFLWNTQRNDDPSGRVAFNYVSVFCNGTGGQSSAIDLNALLTPLFGWLGKNVDPVWWTRGDQIFSGIQVAFDGNRQSSENFSSSMRYPGYQWG